VGAKQHQQKRDFFLRTDLDHDDLLFASLVGAARKSVQDNRVSGLFQACFVGGGRGFLLQYHVAKPAIPPAMA
jgi:hypothetical protein